MAPALAQSLLAIAFAGSRWAVSRVRIAGMEPIWGVWSEVG